MTGCNITEQNNLFDEHYGLSTITALQLLEIVLDNHSKGVRNRLRVIAAYELLLLWLDAARIKRQTSGEQTVDTATAATAIESPEYQLPIRCLQYLNEMEKFGWKLLLIVN